MSKQIFSKIAKIGEEVRNIQLANAFTPQLKEAISLTKQINSLFDTASKRNEAVYSAAKQLLAIEQSSQAVFSKIEQLIADYTKAENTAKNAAKELGIDITSIPDFNESTKAIAILKDNADEARNDMQFFAMTAEKVLR